MEMWSTTTKISFIGCCLFAYQSTKIFDKRQFTNIDYYDRLSLPSSKAVSGVTTIVVVVTKVVAYSPRRCPRAKCSESVRGQGRAEPVG